MVSTSLNSLDSRWIPGAALEREAFVAIVLVLWAMCAMACGLVRTENQFWWMRLLLGVAEGGVWPAVLVLLANWFRRGERARANALCVYHLVFNSFVNRWIRVLFAH